MEIREIRPQDAEKFVKFYEKLAAESDYLMFTPKEVAEKTADEEKFIKKYNDYKQVFLALKEGEIVGYLGIRRSHLARLLHTAKVTVGVLADYQRQKIATKLLEYAENWAKERKIKRLEITVIEENEAAVSLFKENGYEREGVRKGAVKLDDEYVDELFMAKVL